MKSDIAAHVARIPTLLTAIALAGCATRPPDFGGRWEDANRYADATQAIPLQQPHVFAPSPMDGTLRTMLQRWTTDAGLSLQYELADDYTLFSGVSHIRSADLREAAARVGEAYAAQHIAVAVEGDCLRVRALAAPAPSR